MLDATVVTKTNPEMRVVSEEIFAPVAVVEKFSDFEEAVEMANQTKYGLQAGVFTQRFKQFKLCRRQSRIRRRDNQRRADFPRGQYALRRHQRVRFRARRRALCDGRNV